MVDHLVPMDLDTLVPLEIILLDHQDQDNTQDMVHILDLKAGTDRITEVKEDHHPPAHLGLLVQGIQACLPNRVFEWADRPTCQVKKDLIPDPFQVVTMDHSLTVPP